jgi:hypothetical protein
LWWGRPVPFTSQIGLQVSLTLGQYSKGSHTPASAQPLGARPPVLSHRDVQVFISLCLTGESSEYTLTSAQPLGSPPPVLNHRNVLLSRSLSHYVSQENHLEYHIISILCTEETSTSFHLRLRENDTPNSWASSPHTGAHSIPSPSQRGTTHPSHGHTQLMGFLTPHRGTQRSFSVSERNNTPNSWALSQTDLLSLCPGGCLTQL